ncbi:MAG TPA: flagellar basal body-associated FliL family protein [Gemmatimonadaceae bacterium]|nr:flagellar basal body-associated FliL family protein [Gemmatimonadaceae bacterium]
MSEEEIPTEETAEPKAKRGLPKFLMPLLLILTGLGSGGFVGAKVVGPKLTVGIEKGLTTAELTAHGGPKKPGEEGEAAAGDAEKAAEHGEGGAAAPLYTISDLVLNPAGSGGTRFLMMSVAFDVKDSSSVEMLKARDAEIKDAVLALVGSRTVEQLAEVSEREPLKLEINAVVTRITKKNLIKRVSFPQFVIQ